MKIEEVKQILNKNDLVDPVLEVLVPSIHDYSVHLIQPKGDIEASTTRVGHRDRPGSEKQCIKFLEEAANQRAALVVAPEYSIPWNALKKAILEDILPGASCLWALGCESITLSELDALKGDLKGKAEVLCEDFDRKEAEKKGFFDPLTYVFWTKDTKNNGRLVLLIQFKTNPSIDADRIEGDNLFCGKTVYAFGRRGETIRLLTLICSDAFVANETNLKDFYDRTLLLHIQLNPNPRQSGFRSYRKYLFETADDQTEIICLNWALNVKEWKENVAQPKDWKNIGGSAWYLRPDKFNYSDQRIEQNHLSGLYYTRLKPMKWHALFFNYDPAVFMLNTSKVWQHGFPKAQQNRSGPRLEGVSRWNQATEKWEPVQASIDGFENLVNPYGINIDILKHIYTSSPVDVERLLALTAGKISNPDNWHCVTELDSFSLDESECIKRITFTQDLEQICCDFRDMRLRNFVACRDIEDQFTHWPPELSDLANGYQFVWNEQNPHNNIISNAGRYATLVYLGEVPLDKDLRAVGDKLRIALHRQQQPKERVGIFYRQQGRILVWQHPDSKRYDKPSSASSTDIADTPL
jgi:hypothetical protein